MTRQRLGDQAVSAVDSSPARLIEPPAAAAGSSSDVAPGVSTALLVTLIRDAAPDSNPSLRRFRQKEPR